MAHTSTFFLWTSTPAHRSYAIFIAFLRGALKSSSGGRRGASPGSHFPLRASRCRERQTVVLAWHPAHIVGPARNTNVKPIFGAAPPMRILSFFMRGGAPERMGYCW